MTNYLPSEIRQKNELARRKALEIDLRARIKAELDFMALRNEDKEQLRREYLSEKGFDPDIPMKDNPWLARLAYHRAHIELIRDHDFMAFYLKQLEVF